MGGVQASTSGVPPELSGGSQLTSLISVDDAARALRALKVPEVAAIIAKLALGTAPEGSGAALVPALLRAGILRCADRATVDAMRAQAGVAEQTRELPSVRAELQSAWPLAGGTSYVMLTPLGVAVHEKLAACVGASEFAKGALAAAASTFPDAKGVLDDAWLDLQDAEQTPWVRLETKEIVRQCHRVALSNYSAYQAIVDRETPKLCDGTLFEPLEFGIAGLPPAAPASPALAKGTLPKAPGSATASQRQGNQPIDQIRALIQSQDFDQAAAAVLRAKGKLSAAEIAEIIPPIIDGLDREDEDQLRVALGLYQTYAARLPEPGRLSLGEKLAEAHVANDDDQTWRSFVQNIASQHGLAELARELVSHAATHALDEQNWRFCKDVTAAAYTGRVIGDPELLREMFAGLCENEENEVAMELLSSVCSVVALEEVSSIFSGRVGDLLDDDPDSADITADLTTLKPSLKGQFPALVAATIEACLAQHKAPGQAAKLIKEFSDVIPVTQLAALTKRTWEEGLTENEDEAIEAATELLRGVENRLGTRFPFLVAECIELALANVESDDAWLSDVRATLTEFVGDLPRARRREFIASAWSKTVDQDSEEPSDDAHELLGSVQEAMEGDFADLLVDVVEHAAGNEWWPDLNHVLDEFGDAIPGYAGRASNRTARLSRVALTVLEADEEGAVDSDTVTEDLDRFMVKVDPATRMQLMATALRTLLQSADWDVDVAEELVKSHREQLPSVGKLFSELVDWANGNQKADELFDLAKCFKRSFAQGHFGAFTERLQLSDESE